MLDWYIDWHEEFNDDVIFVEFKEDCIEGFKASLTEMISVSCVYWDSFSDDDEKTLKIWKNKLVQSLNYTKNEPLKLVVMPKSLKQDKFWRLYRFLREPIVIEGFYHYKVWFK